MDYVNAFFAKPEPKAVGTGAAPTPIKHTVGLRSVQWNGVAGSSVVILRHDTVLGAREIIVDGTLVHSVHSHLIDSGSSSIVKVGPGAASEAVVEVLPAKSGIFGYKCAVDGAEVKQVVWSSGRCDGAFRMRVTGHRVVGGTYVAYALALHRPGAAAPQLAEARFSEIVELDTKVQSYYIGGHMYGNLPATPKRGIKLMQSALSEAFIEKRKRGLPAQPYIVALRPLIQVVPKKPTHRLHSKSNHL